MNKTKLTLLLLLGMFFISCNLSSAWAAKSSASETVTINVQNGYKFLWGKYPIFVTASSSDTRLPSYSHKVKYSKNSVSLDIDTSKYGYPPYTVTFTNVFDICVFHNIENNADLSVNGNIPFSKKCYPPN